MHYDLNSLTLCNATTDNIKNMRTFGRVMAISCGVFFGGGIGFYIRENYSLRAKQKEHKQLEKEWKALVEIRREREKRDKQS